MADKNALPFVAPVRTMNMLWIGIVGAAVVAAFVWGTPHLRVSYSWNGRDAAPYYYLCRYWGLSSFQVRPANGQCPLVVFAHADAER